MRKLTLSLLAGAGTLALGGVAWAQPAAAPQHEMTRAAFQQRADQLFDKLDQADREARQKLRFDRLDTNHDGQVSFAEFTAARARFDQGRNDRGAQRGERRHGADGQHRLAFRGFAGQGLFRMADADKDGTVTKAEFEAAALQRFDRLDANHDGVVTRDEANAARDNMRQQWQSRRHDRNG